MLCNVCVVVNIVVILQVKLMQNANNKNKLSKHGLVIYLKSKACFVSYGFIFYLSRQINLHLIYIK